MGVGGGGFDKTLKLWEEGELVERSDLFGG